MGVSTTSTPGRTLSFELQVLHENLNSPLLCSGLN